MNIMNISSYPIILAHISASPCQVYSNGCIPVSEKLVTLSLSSIGGCAMCRVCEHIASFPGPKRRRKGLVSAVRACA